MPRLTLWGMYQYDPTLFDNLVLPQGMDKATMIDHIMQEVGDLWPYYQVPPRIKSLIGTWSMRKLPGWQKMWDALQIEYAPLDNYNRIEYGEESPNLTRQEIPDITHRETPDMTYTDSPDITRSRKPDLTTTDTGKTTTTSDSNSTSSTTGNVGSATTTSATQSDSREDQVSAFDTPSYVPRNKTTSSGNNSGNETVKSDKTESGTVTDHGVVAADATSTSKQTGTETETETGTTTRRETGMRTATETGSRTTTETGTTSYKRVTKGNVGVTTSQQMLREELEIRLYDLYEVICGQFADEFIVLIY